MKYINTSLVFTSAFGVGFAVLGTVNAYQHGLAWDWPLAAALWAVSSLLGAIRLSAIQ